MGGIEMNLKGTLLFLLPAAFMLLLMWLDSSKDHYPPELWARLVKRLEDGTYGLPAYDYPYLWRYFEESRLIEDILSDESVGILTDIENRDLTEDFLRLEKYSNP